LFTQGRQAVLTGTQEVESEPADGRPRWAIGAALLADGGPDAGITPDIWYANLVYFTGPIRDPRRLVALVAARRQMEITELQVTGIQIVRWDYTATGMVPIVLAAAADHVASWEG
jgi:hypothetical protein